jgi:hypothetical protein
LGNGFVDEIINNEDVGFSGIFYSDKIFLLGF